MKKYKTLGTLAKIFYTTKNNGELYRAEVFYPVTFKERIDTSTIQLSSNMRRQFNYLLQDEANLQLVRNENPPSPITQITIELIKFYSKKQYKGRAIS